MDIQRIVYPETAGLDDLRTHDYPRAVSWTDYLSARLGTRKWFVGARMTARQRDRSYEIAISPRRYKQLEEEYAAALAPHADPGLPASPHIAEAFAVPA